MEGPHLPDSDGDHEQSNMIHRDHAWTQHNAAEHGTLQRLHAVWHDSPILCKDRYARLAVLCEGGGGSHLPDSTLRRIWGTDPASKGVRPLSIQNSRHPAAQMSTSAPHPERHVKGCMHQRHVRCWQERNPQLSWTGVQGSTPHSAAGAHTPKSRNGVLPRCLTCASNALRVCHQLGRHELRGTFRIIGIL